MGKLTALDVSVEFTGDRANMAWAWYFVLVIGYPIQGLGQMGDGRFGSTGHAARVWHAEWRMHCSDLRDLAFRTLDFGGLVGLGR